MVNSSLIQRKRKKKVTLDHLTHRMRRRPVKTEVEYIKDIIEEFFEKRLYQAKNIKSPPFTMTKKSKNW